MNSNRRLPFLSLHPFPHHSASGRLEQQAMMQTQRVMAALIRKQPALADRPQRHLASEQATEEAGQ